MAVRPGGRVVRLIFQIDFTNKGRDDMIIKIPWVKN
jgi:hypothetical protein